jgi:phosphoenolpyruvate carboxykinase (ATP)
VSDKKTGLEVYGLTNTGVVKKNLTAPELYEEIIKNGEGRIANGGAMVCLTGAVTGRSPNDKFIVEEDTTKADVNWSKGNVPISEEKFEALYGKVLSYLQKKNIYVQECYAGADESSRIKVRSINEFAWQNLFIRNMFIQEKDPAKLENFEADFTIICCPNFKADPQRDGVNSENFILLNFKKKIVIIGGTGYAGEMKKSIFTVMNYLLPKKGIMSMHCSANIGKEGDVALFFGLSGTGKTTLSTDPERALIGDDEHGWDDKGVFNIEGGCYAKVINLSKEMEPDIYATTQMFGTILENVIMDDDRDINLDSAHITENTRASYPLESIDNIEPSGKGGQPKNVIFLTFDAFGVLPPVSKLSVPQAMYHFISGYTARVAGTEKGVTEPSAVFSSCFGQPFMVWHPSVYAKLLGEKIIANGANCYLVNTGLTGGPYGVGTRFKISHTRQIIKAILSGEIDKSEFIEDEIFGFGVPKTLGNIPEEVIHPVKSWKDQAAYKAKLTKLAEDFKANFKKYEAGTAPDIIAGGPRI